MLPARAGLVGGGPLAVVVTFLLASLFYAVTLHLAATFYIGDVPTQRAAAVGPVLAAVSLLLRRYGLERPEFALVTIAVTLLADLLAVRFAYRLELRSAVPVVVLHFAFAVIVGVTLVNLLGVA